MEKRDIANAIVRELIARRRKARLAIIMSFVLVVAGALIAMHYGRRSLPLMLGGIGLVMSAAFLLEATGEPWSDPFVMEGRPKPRGVLAPWASST